MTRAEKLFCIRAQVQKAASDIDHGDTYGACLALGDALSAVLEFLEEELPEKAFDLGVHFPMPKEAEVKEILRKEAESFAGLPEEQQPFAGDPTLAKQRKRR